MSKILTPEQCRMARAALNLKPKQLSELASVGLNTVIRFETSSTAPHKKTGEKLRTTFENEGVRFTDDGCVCYSECQDEKCNDKQ